MWIKVVVQPRHAHLSREDAEKLFGIGVSLNPALKIGHKGQVVHKETLTVSGKAGTIDSVRIIGPVRGQTQVELSATDAHALGVRAPVRVSGDAAHAGWIVLEGPAGSLRLRAAIIPARHLHCSERDAKAFGIRHHDVVALEAEGREDLAIEHIIVRVHPTFATEFHLTADEAAAYWLGDAARVRIRPL